jgi:putative nucleotidyltransferase with HDIG domain
MPEGRILIVDDEASVRDVVSSLLERLGYETVTVGGAIEALLAMKEQSAYDLVLSDIMMPGIDGLELLDQIALNHPGTPVIMCSAVHDVHVATSAFRRGAIDYLLKPFERKQLISVVTRGLEHSRLQIQNQTYRENLEELVSARTGRLRATMQDLERSYDFTLEAMGDALDLRDAETEGHSRRVTTYTIALARELGMSTSELRVIARGAFLHDIGKIATPDRILLKPGKLDPDEMAIMREHCERGYEMVRKIPFLREASEIVLSHQESYDGSGYPRGLKGDEIPLGARIFAVADTLDAMTSDRPYRKAASFEDARTEIARCGGKQFDPLIVEAFLKVPIERWRELRFETGRLSSSSLYAALFRPGAA